MWRKIFHRAVQDEDIAEELESHLAIEVARLMEDGLSREEAESGARRALGNLGLIRETTREAWGSVWLERLSQDVRYGVRTLRRSPGFTIATILSLALGIGASTAIFSLVDTVFLRPLPYVDSNRLVWAAIRFPSMKAEFVPSPDFVAWRRDNQAFEQLSAVQADGSETVILSDPVATEVHASRVSFNFLSTFAVSPLIGHNFRPEEERPSGPKAILLMNRFWRDHFHSNQRVIGRVVRLGGQQYVIIGVLPESFVFPMDVKVDLLTTLPVSPTASHRDRSMSIWAVFGKLKPGISTLQAKANLETLFAASKADAPRMFRSDTKLVIDSLQHHRIGDAHLLLTVLSGAVAFLLFIACANVANLLLARWSSQSRELAVRAAIGAGRNRLIRQLFTETALLTTAGCALGLMIVVLSLSAFAHYAGDEIPRLSEVTVDARVLLIAAITSCVTTLLFGWLPALRAGSVDIQSILQSTGRLGLSAGHRRMRRVLVAGEIAIALILLSGASLLLETVWHLENDRLGFQPEHVLTMTLELRGSKLDTGNQVSLAGRRLAFHSATSRNRSGCPHPMYAAHRWAN